MEARRRVQGEAGADAAGLDPVASESILPEPAHSPPKRVRAYSVVDGRVASIPIEEAGARIRKCLESPTIPVTGGGEPPVWLDIVGPDAEEGEFLRGLGIHH